MIVASILTEFGTASDYDSNISIGFELKIVFGPSFGILWVKLISRARGQDLGSRN